MNTKGKAISTAQKKIEAVAKLKAWAEEKIKEGSLHQYVFRGQLNRSVIALELGIARSTLSKTNKLARDELKRIESEFIPSGSSFEGSDEDDEKRLEPSALEDKLASKEREVNKLRQRLAVLIAENEELKKKLASNNSILDEIIPSGRRVQL